MEVQVKVLSIYIYFVSNIFNDTIVECFDSCRSTYLKKVTIYQILTHNSPRHQLFQPVNLL